ncbi:MAG TPA: VTT domain-containing protein [Nocardioidaceae bacterium]|nr:VTT domain-containing protein [Nocardioidaceae bacterium]
MPPTLLFGISWLDPQKIIDAFGQYAMWGVLVILFAECGLLIGFFLPGDSLLFTVGLLISQGVIETPLWLACLLMTAAAIAGNVVGYAIGARAGPAILSRPNSRLFKQSHVDKTRAFFEKYGNRAIVLARFVPIVRTFITVVAGVAGMSMRRFVTYSAIGGVLWATGVTILGYYLGQIALVREHIELMLLAIVAVSVLPIAFEVLRAQLSSRSSSENAAK